MASRESILNRRNALKKYIYDKGNGKLNFKSIQKFYSTNYSKENLSVSTIRTDLKEIGVKCNKIRNTYYFSSYDDIIKSKELLENLLKECTIYKPLKLATTLATSSFIYNDKNPRIKLSYILIRSNSKEDLTLIPKFIGELRRFYSLKELDLDLLCMDIIVNNHYMEFLFDNYKDLKVLYKQLYELKYGEYFADEPIPTKY